MKKFKRIYIEITNICNKNCSFCSTSKKPKQHMSLAQFEFILKQIQPYTNYIYLHVKGEPLLHPNLQEILELCNQYKIHVNITTNGTLISKQEKILQNSPALRQLNISLHSFEDTDKDHYILPILNSISNIKKERNLIVVYRFWALQNYKLTQANRQLLDKIINYYQLDSEVIQKIEQDTNIKIANDIYINKHELFEWPTLASSDIEIRGFCYGMSTQIAILVDGTVVPCCLDSEGIINLGNIFETSFKEIINGKRAQHILKSFRDGNVTEELCQKCKYRRMLKRGIMVARSDTLESSNSR